MIHLSSQIQLLSTRAWHHHDREIHPMDSFRRLHRLACDYLRQFSFWLHIESRSGRSSSHDRSGAQRHSQLQLGFSQGSQARASTDARTKSMSRSKTRAQQSSRGRTRSSAKCAYVQYLCNRSRRPPAPVTRIRSASTPVRPTSLRRMPHLSTCSAERSTTDRDLELVTHLRY